MKVCIVLVYLLIVTCQSNAQQRDDEFYQAKAERYKNMKHVGTALTILGSVSMILAIAHVNQDYSSNYAEDYQTGDKFAVAGAVLLSSGIPLWIVGARSEGKYNKKLKDVSVYVNANSQSKGLTLQLRF